MTDGKEQKKTEKNRKKLSVKHIRIRLIGGCVNKLRMLACVLSANVQLTLTQAYVDIVMHYNYGITHYALYKSTTYLLTYMAMLIQGRCWQLTDRYVVIVRWAGKLIPNCLEIEHEKKHE